MLVKWEYKFDRNEYGHFNIINEYKTNGCGRLHKGEREIQLEIHLMASSCWFYLKYELPVITYMLPTVFVSSAFYEVM